MPRVPVVVCDFATPDGPRRRVLRSPERVFLARRLDEVAGVLDAAEQARDEGLVVAGYLAYEAAPAFDPALDVPPAGELPLAWFAAFRDSGHTAPTPGQHRVGQWRPAVDEDAYRRCVDEVRRQIGDGFTYQTNYTVRLRAELDGDPFGFYEELRAAQNGSYSAYLDTGRFVIASASPELFFDWRDGVLTTRPMKGTARRGRWPAEDEARRAELLASGKNRAENLMIVDLLRNDVHRVAEPGTVAVPELFALERYPTVWQLTSTVTARTRAGSRLRDVLGALFPCGSITGAPRTSTMQLISRLEPEPRGVYCGGIGLLDQRGATFSVPIRTVVIDTVRGAAEYGVGGGVTWDSTAQDEYAEVLAKAAVLTARRPPFDLLETMLMRDGEIVDVERHLARMSGSAGYFGYLFDEATVRRRLDECRLEAGADSFRVRLLSGPRGDVRVERHELPTGPPRTWRGALAAEPVRSDDVFLFHKTTNRAVYEQRRAGSPDVDDVLLHNERGELTEWTIGSLVVELDGRLLTPPVACGLLAGTARARALEAGQVHERVLSVADLPRVRRLWLLNALRGWVPIELDHRSLQPR